MTKYIRTKDNKFYDLHKYWSSAVSTLSKDFDIGSNKDQLIKDLMKAEYLLPKDCKIADNIESVTDFIVVQFKFEKIEDIRFLSTKKHSVKNIIATNGLSLIKSLRLAILTDAGLIYVAELDKKGNIEVL